MIFGIDASTLAAFAVTSALIEVTPGPNMTYLAIIAATEGRQKGYAAVAGVALGLALLGLLAALGLGAVVAASPVIFRSLKWAGVAYLLWLAWEAWQDSSQKIEHAKAGSTLWQYFERGLITNLLNPKALVFYVTMLPSFLGEVDPTLGQTLTLSVTFVVIATTIHFLIVTLAGFARKLLEAPNKSKVIRRVMAVTLVGVAVWFAVG
jgi:threonine/homoserine/homoserine lactone efflux protein